MLNEDMPTLDENDAATCEGKVTLEETSAALNKMKNGSAPGYDGITTEFMKFFWSKVGALGFRPRRILLHPEARCDYPTA